MADEIEVILTALADESDDIDVDAHSAVIEYLRDGRLFAFREGDVVELKLVVDIAEAARRTPDVGESSRGEEWITFAPPEWNEMARDRLTAWFRVAHRFATQ